MLLAPLLLALPLLAQSPPSRPALGPVPPAAAGEPPDVAINSAVELKAPGLAAINAKGMRGLLALLARDDQTVDQRRPAYEALRRAGHVVEFVEPVRVTVREARPDATYRHDRTGRPIVVYSGPALGGPLGGQTLYFLDSQLAGPTAEGLATQEELDRATLEKAYRVYRAAKTAKNAAKAKAGFADPSVRKHVLERETAAWRKRLMKAEKLPEEELDRIIAWGEEEDGTTDRIAAKNLGGKARAQAANDAQLMAIGAMIDRAGAQVLANKAAADARAARDVALRRGGSFSIPPMGGTVVRGDPWSTWAAGPFYVRTR